MEGKGDRFISSQENKRSEGKEMDQQTNQLEGIGENIRDAVNVLQLLMQELYVNQDDQHIIRSISIVIKMLNAALSYLPQVKED